jgi:hypothetical protein
MTGWLLTLTWLALAAGPAVEVAGPERTFRLFPEDDLYPAYKADHHRARFGLVYHAVPSAGIAGSGEARFDLRLGGRFGLLRVTPRDRLGQDRPGRAWQLSLIAGFDGQFDIDNSYDNVGWDGNYGLAFTTSRGRGPALKVALFHTSSHVGDEYAERTGRLRIGYTREEVSAGLAWTIGRRWRAYAEGAWGYVLRNEELMEPGRAQVGLEVEAAESLWKRRIGWYAALDVSATEERDWSVDVSLDVGLLLRSGARTWRAGLGFYDGRVPLGEFFRDDERYVSFGLWLDV